VLAHALSQQRCVELLHCCTSRINPRAPGCCLRTTLQGDSALVLDALMYRRGISSKEISVSYHKATLLLAAFEHVDFQYIPRWGPSQDLLEVLAVWRTYWLHAGAGAPTYRGWLCKTTCISSKVLGDTCNVHHQQQSMLSYPVSSPGSTSPCWRLPAGPCLPAAAGSRTRWLTGWLRCPWT
jgi:hypothetical protein